MNDRLITRILFATDFSACAARAQLWAASLATAWEAHVEVLHVIEGPAWLNVNAAALPFVEAEKKEAARRLEEAREELAQGGITAGIRQVMGQPSEHICHVARELRADLLVLGAQGRMNLLYGLLGSTAERVIKDAPCPVLAVPTCRDDSRPPVAKVSPAAIQHILAPVDISSPSLDSLEYAIQAANRLGAKLTILHVLEPVYHDFELGLGKVEQEPVKRAHWEDRLEELAAFVRSFGLTVDSAVCGGVPSDSILAAALQRQCDLIVMGTHGRRGFSQFRFGSVAEAVLRLATCPVLTVKTPKFAPGLRRVVPQAMAEA